MFTIDHRLYRIPLSVLLKKHPETFKAFLKHVKTRLRKLSIPNIFGLTSEYYGYYQITDDNIGDTVHVLRLHFDPSINLHSIPPEFCLRSDGISKLL